MLQIGKDYIPYESKTPIWYPGCEEPRPDLSGKREDPAQFLDISNLTKPSIAEMSLSVSHSKDFFYNKGPAVLRFCKIHGRGNIVDGWHSYEEWRKNQVLLIMEVLRNRDKELLKAVESELGMDRATVYTLYANFRRTDRPMHSKKNFRLGRDILRCWNKLTKAR